MRNKCGAIYFCDEIITKIKKKKKRKNNVAQTVEPVSLKVKWFTI